MIKLGADKLRDYEPTKEELASIKRNPIYFVLDEILDTFNVGSMFRLADAVAAEKIYLCGNMETPPSSRIHKAAVGTENWVPWEKRDSALEVVKELKEKSFQPGRLPARRGVQIISVEQSKRAISYKLLAKSIKFPCAVVIGHETHGVSEEVLKESDIIVELPMYGINKSFNV